ncbi:MAG: DNA translocase FtsK 4TM domain-containing protein [Hyphomicrobiaceae bacterium]
MSIDNHIGEPQRLISRTIEDVLRNWMLRGGGVALVVATVIVWIAMLSWSADDPSLSLNTSEPAQNMLGPFGAVIADFFFHTLGLSVVFFVVPPLVLGLQLALGDRIADRRQRLAMIGISTVAIAAGCSALPLVSYWPLELGYGGIIGDFAYSVVVSLLTQIAPGASGAIAGIAFFALGFWAFSRAICLDTYNIFTLTLPHFDRRRLKPLRTVRPGFSRLWRRPATAAPEQDASPTYDAAVLTPAYTETREEPEPPAWSMDAPLSAYRQAAGAPDAPAPASDRTVQGGAPNAELAEQDAAFSRIAERFAAPRPADPRLGPAPDAVPQGQVVLLDEDADQNADDLPSVLKRARQEAAQLLPGPNHQTTPPPLPAAMAAGPAAAGTVSAAAQPAVHPVVVATGYRRPSLNLLKAQKAARPSADSSSSVLQGRARILEDVLRDFRIKGEVQDVRPGPVVTLFELEPSRGTKSSRVIALADDVARSMSAASARIAVVPGRNAIGIELPNTRRETFGLRELIDSQTYVDSGAKLPLVLGKGIGGETVITDLARMPHLLVAGTTGSGKSVGVNAMILSLIYRLGPEDCRFLMIDPKMLELSAYNGIPHLLTPVITDPQKAVTALAWAVGEMEERYKRMAELGVRNIDAFNNRVRHAIRTGEKLGRTVQTGFDPATGEAIFEETTLQAEPLPYIVIVVDEFADLMAVAGKEIESLVQRLAQMARAAGIHMIMATQRPSVDVVTGTIKANFPTRISYRVASRIDSRTILNEQGAEQLLGQGDMLFLSGSGDVQRVHGPFVSDEEVEAISTSLARAYPSDYIADILTVDAGEVGRPDGGDDKAGDLYEQAIAIVLRDKKASTSYLQRRLSIGYNRAADLIDRMEAEGVISAADHAGRREILLAG